MEEFTQTIPNGESKDTEANREIGILSVVHVVSKV